MENLPSSHARCLDKILAAVESGDIDLTEFGVAKKAKKTNVIKRHLNVRQDSKPTYHVVYSEEGSAAAQFVIRMRPPDDDANGCHEVLLECKVMRELKSLDVPVPRVAHRGEWTGLTGTEFFIMEYVEGCTITDNSLTSLDPWQRQNVFDSVVEAISHLHSLPLSPRMEKLLDPNEQFPTTQDCWRLQLQWWRNNIGRHARDNPQIRECFEKLEEMDFPNSRNRTIVHFDLNIDNMRFDPVTFQLKAILDWEMVTIADPLCDLANFCMMFSSIPVSEDPSNSQLKRMLVDNCASGIPSQKELLENYCRKRGPGIVISSEEYHFAKALNCLRFLYAFRPGLEALTSLDVASDDDPSPDVDGDDDPSPDVDGDDDFKIVYFLVQEARTLLDL